VDIFKNKTQKNKLLGKIKEELNVPKEKVNNIWYRLTDGNTVIVFVHGIFSDSNNCWFYKNKNDILKSQYWPNLLTQDPEFDDISIFLGGYYTALDSQDYDAEQASKELFSAIKRPIQIKNGVTKAAVTEKNNLIFVCHSTGGIVARHLLYHNSNFFKNKAIGIVLIASPSHGAKMANNFENLAEFYNNKLGKQLQWKNSFLKRLDRYFKDLVYEKRIPNLTGKEAVENHFIAHNKWLPCFSKELLVNEDSAVNYFNSVIILRDTDHFSAVKPANRTHPAYELLLDFKNEFLKSNKQQSNAADYVDKLRMKILILRGDYEASEEKGDLFSRKVRLKAAPLGELLKKVSELELDLGSKISKYEYAAYAYFLAASVETKNTKLLEYSCQVLELGIKCVQIIESARKQAAKGNKGARAVINWVNANQDAKRICFIMAAAHAINYRTGGDSTMKDVHSLLNEISPEYLEDFPPTMHPDLSFVLNEKKKIIHGN